MKRILSWNSVLILSMILALAVSLSSPRPVQALDPNGEWTLKAPMPTARGGIGLTSANGILYAFGGYNGAKLNIVEAYDIASDSWSTRTSMPTVRSSMGAVTASNGKIYVIGGHNDIDGALSTVEEYDPLTDTWATRSPMPTPRQSPGVIAAPNGKIYVIGGTTDTNLPEINVVEEYDPLTDTWNTRAPMPTARQMAGTALGDNGKIYVIGGYFGVTPLDVVEEYDPAADTWTTRAPLPIARLRVEAVTLNGKIYAIGGHTQYQPYNRVDEYDPASNTWVERTPITLPILDHRAVKADTNNHIYVIGGWGNNQYLQLNQEFTPPPTLVNAVPSSTELYPGDSLTVGLNIQNAYYLYGVQTVCSVDPAVLALQNAAFGNLFDPVNNLVGANTLDPATGTWTGAISQRSPALPISGEGSFAALSYTAGQPGASAISCEPLLSDPDGFSQPVLYNSTSVTVLAFAHASGVARYQGRQAHTGIQVSFTGGTTNTVFTSNTGAFNLDTLRADDYSIRAEAVTYLPICTTETLTNGQVLTLPTVILRGGDANGDEDINIGDATLIAGSFGMNVPPANPLADINADNRVNIQDLAILGSNFGLSGCQSW